MAKVTITLEDIGENQIRYQSQCLTPEQTNLLGEPTTAIKLAGDIIRQLQEMQNNTKRF